jgi:hypothetical protein
VYVGGERERSKGDPGEWCSEALVGFHGGWSDGSG